MKIKIIRDLPLQASLKPPVGSIHKVVETQKNLNFINYKGEKVGIYNHECELVKETEPAPPKGETP